MTYSMISTNSPDTYPILPLNSISYQPLTSDRIVIVLPLSTVPIFSDSVDVD